MASDPASILEAIKRGGWEASLFTTFNATIPFYEDVLLRKLTAVGCRNNVLLMDRRQCALAYASEATRPRLAGIAYTLVPIHVAGAFHPKLGLLAGKKRASVFVGSHNLTISGFGYNREVTNHVDMMGAPGALERNLLSQTWSAARTWISELGTDLPPSLLRSAYALDAAFGTPIVDDPDSPARLIAQHPGSPGLLDQLESLVTSTVRRITVLGAFFDREGAFLSELARRWKDADIVVGIDPLTVWMPGMPSDPRLRFVDVGNLGNHKTPGYLHAKAIYFEGGAGEHLFASGSANPSAPAWRTAHARPNVEAMLVRRDQDALSCAYKLGMDTLARLPTITTTALADIQSRSRSINIAHDATCPSLYVGIAEHDAQMVLVRVEDLPFFDAIEALSENDQTIAGAMPVVANSDGFHIPQGLALVRTLLLRSGTTVVGRLLVHHPALIAHRVNGAARDPVGQLLRQLGSAFEDISRVLPFLEKFIFSNSVSDAVRMPVAGAVTDKLVDAAIARPDSLAISLSDVRRTSKPSLFSVSHDLNYLIDILMRRIDVRDDGIERGVDRIGRSEEEQIGQDDDDSGEPVSTALVQEITDAQIAVAVRGKATKLMRRMGRALRQGDRSPQSTMTLVVQLVGVIALLRELAHLELADRWRRAHTCLLEIDDLQELLDVSARTMFTNGSEALLALSDENSIPPEEVIQLRSLLLWLAWRTKQDWFTPPGRNVGEKTLDRAITNALLLEMLRHVGDDSEQWAAVRQSIELTLSPDPTAALAANRWFARHHAVGQQLAGLVNAEEAFGAAPLQSILLGDIVQVPGVIDVLSIAVGNDGRYISIHVGEGKPRRFDLPRVRWMARL